MLDRLAKQIKSGKVSLLSRIGNVEVDALVDARDSENFEQRWLASFTPIDQRAAEIGKEDESAIDRLREVSYKVAYDALESSDIAAFVSDDFELIGRALVLQVEDPWLNGIWMQYKQGEFPSGEVAETHGALLPLIG